MSDKIQITWPVSLRRVPKKRLLRRIARKTSLLEKVISRLPSSIMNSMYDEEYTVNERSVETGFVFMNLGDARLDAKVLDVGCNESVLALELASLGFKVWGLDIAIYPFQHPNINFVKADVCKTGFAGDYFDIVTAVSSIEHVGLGHYGDPIIPDGDAKALAEIHRILKPDGKLILTLPYGAPVVTEFLRNYDMRTLAALIRDFEVLRSAYFIKADEKFWCLSDEKSASGMAINEFGMPEGNVCLCLRKKNENHN